ncbi:uncharacterized protein cd28 isoform X2 [Cololabis saira]|uniref:uncharacterized protein cd28 isoform X2 n=1 Tax=Cololabis saira TaxID=129043 RepID=UPI002AD27D52|nr:uncharacterized protein cd28 isoform X2 [Cololabis saira]
MSLLAKRCRHFLCCRTLSMTTEPGYKIVKVTQPYRVLSTDGTAQISCVIHPRPAFHQPELSQDQHQRYPYPDPKDLRVALLKGLHGKQELCYTRFSVNEIKPTEGRGEGEVQCSALARGGAVEVTVTGLKAADTDIYRCEIEVSYPPPFLNFTGNGTLIHVADSPHCPAQMAQKQMGQGADDDAEDEEEEENEITTPTSVPVVILVIAIICVLVVILTFQTLQCERGRKKVIWTLPPIDHRKVDAVSFLSEDIA